MRRHAIGVIAIVLLLGAGLLWVWPLEVAWYEPLKSACFRLGPCMAVLWLAYPEVKRLPAWAWGIIPVLLVLIAWRRAVFLYLLPFIIVLVILHLASRR